MPKTKAQKAQETEVVVDRFGRMASGVLMDFTGVKIHEAEELRNTARAESCEYIVIKKTLLGRAAAAAGIPFDPSSIAGSVSVLFGFADAVAPAKIAKGFVGAHPAAKVLGGFLREESGVTTLDLGQVTALGDLPSRDELRARLVGSLASPMRGFVSVLQGNLRNFVYALHAIQQAKA